MSKWEADGAVPDTDKLIALSKLFGITLNELLQVETPSPEAEKGEIAERPAGRKGRPCLTVVLVCLCLAAALLSLFQVRLLSDRVGALESLANGLDPAAPLVSYFDYRVEGYIYAGGGLGTLSLDLSPYQVLDGMEVSFTANGPDFSETVQAEQGEGGHYTAAFRIKGYQRDLVITALLSDGQRQYVQPLLHFDYIEGDRYSCDRLWTMD